jgi:hypothetical protein
MKNFLEQALILCGISHFALCAGSLFIPKALSWSSHLKNVQPLIRQMFWTYAGYILVINFCFGLISVLGSGELLNHSFLARSISLFIGIYWFSRIAIQFFYFDKSEAPKGTIYTLGEILLVIMFTTFSVAYLAVFFFNMHWI